MTDVPRKELAVGTVVEPGDGLNVVALDDLSFLLEESGPVTTHYFLLPLPHIRQVTTVCRSDICTSEIPQELSMKVCPAPDRVGGEGGGGCNQSRAGPFNMRDKCFTIR